MIEFLEHDDNEISITKFLDDNWGATLGKEGYDQKYKWDNDHQHPDHGNWGASLDKDADGKEHHGWNSHYQHSGGSRNFVENDGNWGASLDKDDDGKQHKGWNGVDENEESDDMDDEEANGILSND